MTQPANQLLHRFIEPGDSLSALLNEKANELHRKLSLLDVQKTGIDEQGKLYFSAHHSGQRLFFSIESSVRIIYDSVKLTGHEPSAISFTDYGAGLGTLFLLAGMTGFKSVYYNDLFPDWTENARILCRELDIPITDFISGDVDAMIEYGKTKNIHFDIFASRNVIEHIYSLPRFYSKLNASGCTTLIYSTTTANYHNPAMLLKHVLFHRKLERSHFPDQRKALIKELAPGIGKKELAQLVSITRGRAFDDFSNAVHNYLDKKPVAPVPFLGSNTCDCRTGVWAENIITKSNYARILKGAGFDMDYTPGFWDTHYRFALVNIFTKAFNGIIRKLGKKGITLAPFVNVVATTDKHE